MFFLVNNKVRTKINKVMCYLFNRGLKDCYVRKKFKPRQIFE